NVAAEFEGDGFVAEANGWVIGFWRVRLVPSVVAAHVIEHVVFADEAAAADGAVAGDENIGEILAPDEAVVKIAMPAVLVAAEGIGFGFIVGVEILRCAENGRAGIDLQVDVAFEVEGAAE